MNCLAIDTSGPVGSIALSRLGAVVAETRFGERESHMREIGHAVDRALSSADLAPRDLHRLAIVSGPGSFTGLRIGMAFVKGLHAATGADVVTIDTLRLLALPFAGEHRWMLSMIDARKNQVYAALYRARAGAESGLETVVEPTVMEPVPLLARIARLGAYCESEGPLICAGSGTAVCADEIIAALGSRARLAPESRQVPAIDMLALRAPELVPVPREELPELEPFYIRSSDAELKRLREVKGGG